MHDVKLLSQAESACLGACLVGVRPGQELPLDVEVEALVFQAPDVACQPGSDPFVGVSEVVSVVVVLVRFPNPLALGSGLGLQYPYRQVIFLSALPA